VNLWAVSDYVQGVKRIERRATARSISGAGDGINESSRHEYWPVRNLVASLKR
jgi:hypothetical protein